ncbi:MAG: TraR/DksA family transcriptional regulator [Rhizobiaceae bacterium]
MRDTRHFKEKLAVRRKELQDMMAEIEDRLDDPKPASFSEQSVEREDDEVLEARGRVEYEELQAIEAALSRMDNNVYGVCLNCQEEISDERLEAVPYATLCRNCMNN